MKNNIQIKPYKKEFTYSYTSGAYATIEMIHARPEIVKAVYIHSELIDKERIERLCSKKGIPVLYGDASFKRVNQKENSYVLGVFEKYTTELSTEKPHILLVNPSDMGNLGTIIRTMAGLNFEDIGIISPAADVWNPKTVRASMGSLFWVNTQYFDSFDAYRAMYTKYRCYPFMLDAEDALDYERCPVELNFSLVFGNEATGLPECFSEVGKCFKIPQSTRVDSLNLSVAAGIGAFIFANKNGMI